MAGGEIKAYLLLKRSTYICPVREPPGIIILTKVFSVTIRPTRKKWKKN